MSTKLAMQILAELREVRALLAPVQRAMPGHPMTPREFAVVCGVHEKTVRRWISRGQLRARRAGHKVLISPVNAQRFLNPDPEGGER